MSFLLLLDADAAGRQALEEVMQMLDPRLRLAVFTDPVSALDWARAKPVGLVLADYRLSQTKDAEFVRKLRALPSCAGVPLVILTQQADHPGCARILEQGADDLLCKPLDAYECLVRCRNLLTARRRQHRLQERTHCLERQIFEHSRKADLREKETLLRLAKAGEYRDAATGNHVLRMASYTRLIAETLDLPPEQCEIIERAAPMHDIGKIGIPDRILLATHNLTAAERRIMESHTRIGYQILKGSPSVYLQAGAEIALSHHEQFDGNGYPSGLRGNRIPVGARVAAVADVFDALVSERPYKAAWSLSRAMDYLVEQRSRKFDPECVDAFLAQGDLVVLIMQELSDTTRGTFATSPD